MPFLHVMRNRIKFCLTLLISNNCKIKAPENIVLTLFLDLYRCYMIASVVKSIQKLRVEVEYIPGNCTYVCQPTDVGVNKPFKCWIYDQWDPE
jgi:DDE superfamily endonuclease